MADFLSNSFTLIICIIIILPILPLIISLLRDIFQKNTNVDNTTPSTYENINEPEHIHVYINGKCTKCGKTDPTHKHSYYNYRCTVCDQIDPSHKHSYQNGRCKICNIRCKHIYKDGKCTICNIECMHIKYVDSKCTICGIIDPDHRHNFINGVCSICNMQCKHIYKNDKCLICGKNCDDYDDNNVFEKEYKNQRVIHRFDLNDEMDKPVLKCPGLNCSNCNRTKCLNEK